MIIKQLALALLLLTLLSSTQATFTNLKIQNSTSSPLCVKEQQSGWKTYVGSANKNTIESIDHYDMKTTYPITLHVYSDQGCAQEIWHFTFNYLCKDWRQGNGTWCTSYLLNNQQFIPNDNFYNVLLSIDTDGTPLITIVGK